MTLLRSVRPRLALLLGSTLVTLVTAACSVDSVPLSETALDDAGPDATPRPPSKRDAASPPLGAPPFGEEWNEAPLPPDPYDAAALQPLWDAASDGAVADGAASDGAVADGAARDGAVADGAVADAGPDATLGPPPPPAPLLLPDESGAYRVTATCEIRDYRRERYCCRDWEKTVTTVCTADVSEVASSSGFTLTVSPMRDCSTSESTPKVRGAFSSSPTPNGNPALSCSGSSPTFGGAPLGPPQLLSGDYVRRTQWVGGASYPLDHLVRTNSGFRPWCALGDAFSPGGRCDGPMGPGPSSGAPNLTELHRTGPGALSAVRGWLFGYEMDGECNGKASSPLTMSYRNTFARFRGSGSVSYVPYTCTYSFEKL